MLRVMSLIFCLSSLYNATVFHLIETGRKMQFLGFARTLGE